MPRKEGQKRKLLVLLQILARETDERHPLSVPQIVEKLKEDGYEVTSSAVSETENAVSIGLFKCESAEASKLAKSLSETFDVRVLVSEIIYTTTCVETE